MYGGNKVSQRSAVSSTRGWSRAVCRSTFDITRGRLFTRSLLPLARISTAVIKNAAHMRSPFHYVDEVQEP